jgi:signal transduction histidine kinase
VSYAAAGTTIEIRVAADAGGATVEIRNEAHGLAAEDLPRLFERFTRKDAARAATGLHAGLGLSICRRLTELQGSHIALRLDGPIFIANVKLPGNT